MNVELIHEFAMQLGNEITDELPFGPDNAVYKVKGKIFLIVALEERPIRFNVKCNPEVAIELREKYTAVLPGYHMNKKHWNTIVVDGSLSDDMLKLFIKQSYNLVAPKRK